MERPTLQKTFWWPLLIHFLHSFRHPRGQHALHMSMRHSQSSHLPSFGEPIFHSLLLVHSCRSVRGQQHLSSFHQSLPNRRRASSRVACGNMPVGAGLRPSSSIPALRTRDRRDRVAAGGTCARTDIKNHERSPPTFTTYTTDLCHTRVCARTHTRTHQTPLQAALATAISSGVKVAASVATKV